MKNQRHSTFAGITAVLVMTSVMTGCIFATLDEDLEKLDQVTYLFAGEILVPDGETDGIVIVAMHDAGGDSIVGFRMRSGSGRFEIRSDKVKTWLFAFLDRNHDLIFQEGEPYAWANSGESINPEQRTTEDLVISLLLDPESEFSAPKILVDEPLENKFANYVKVNIGTVTPLDDPLFSMAQAEKGLWQPFEFTEDGGTGIHFLQDYDQKKIPVLFVHGINGTPQNFRHLIANLDTSRYQAWVLSYPSGMRLSWIARGVFQIIEVLHVQHKFDELHLVAHSMGGLVSKGTLNICVESNSCEYLRSYTTISTPWNGVASAENGTNWSPTVIPVWWDMVPSSEYVSTLFETPMPTDLPYNLLFGYRLDSAFSGESSDGVVALKSQLRHDAQQWAQSVYGYNEGHVSILDSDATVERVNGILAASDD